MSISEYRNNLIGVLRLIASKDEQLSYEREVPPADVPGELICEWFFFRPDSDLFHEAFNEVERDRLVRFHSYFDARVEQLPDSLSEMHENGSWLEVMNEAQLVLHDLGWDEK